MEFSTVFTGNLSATARLSRRVYFRLGDLPQRDQCNVGIIDTDEGVVLIDYPEQNPLDELIREVREMLDKPVTHILFTHAHGDHRNGLPGLADPGIQLWGIESTLAELTNLYPGLSQPMRRVEPGEQALIGGVEFRFWCPPSHPAHSPWDMLVILPGEGVVFTGDFLVPPGYLYFFSCHIENWIAGQEAFLSLPTPGVLAMGHGDPMAKDFCRETVLPHLRDLAALFQDLQDRGVPVSEGEPVPPEAVAHPLYQKLSGIWGGDTVRRQLRELREKK